MKVGFGISITLWALTAIAQPTRPAAAVAQEFPAVFERKVVAGQVAQGSEFHARLKMATLVRGVVVPEGAELRGVVEESAAKSGDSPSRLKIHITQLKWGAGEMALDLYLTDHYDRELTPGNSMSAEQGKTDLPVKGTGSEPSGWRNEGFTSRPVRGTPSSLRTIPLGSDDFDKKNREPSAAPEKAAAATHGKLDGIESVRDASGAILLTSRTHTIKLGRELVYSFEGVAPGAEPAARRAVSGGR
jgi:hypothetical protein